MSEHTIDWEEGATRMLQQVLGGVDVKDRVQRRLEAEARQQGQDRVTATMVQELLDEVSRWGWGGALEQHEPGSIYRGFLGAADPQEAAKRWSTAQGKTIAPAEPIVDFYVETLGLAPGARVLDVGCGWGRIAIPLARRGFAVTAVESSEDWLAIARATAQEEGVDIRLMHGDLSVLPWMGFGDADFDAVLSIGVLFQVFPESDQQARELLLEVSRVLKPGGHCFIGDFMNRDGFLRTAAFESDGTAVTQFWSEEAGTFSLVERRFRVAEGRMYARRLTVGRNGACQEDRRVVRVYTLPELITMLGDAGLVFRRTEQRRIRRTLKRRDGGSCLTHGGSTPLRPCVIQPVRIPTVIGKRNMKYRETSSQSGTSPGKGTGCLNT